MSWLLGKKKSEPANNSNAVNDSMQRIGDQVDKLDKKIDFLEQKQKLELQQAKKIGTKTPALKKKAMIHMKRYKTYQTQIDQFGGQRDNMEAQKSALEMAALVAGNIDAMKHGANAMKKIIDVDAVDDVVADVVDITDRIRDTVDIISQPMGLTEEHDEDDLEQELNDFMAEDEEELEDPVFEDLPSVPVETLPDTPKHAVTTEVDKEAAELLSWMN
eukprot:m.20246 g.20246  ORF g.20246 m.20246 type:complete len:217 (-) comp12830_c1_seq1:122-772(-)